MLTLDTIIITGVGVVADLIPGKTEMTFIEMGLTGFYVIMRARLLFMSHY